MSLFSENAPQLQPLYPQGKKQVFKIKSVKAKVSTLD